MIILTVYICIKSCVGLPNGSYETYDECHRAANTISMKIDGWTCAKYRSKTNE